MVIRPEKAPDERQLALITQQLGRAPRGIQTVAAATQDGTPLVLRMHAIVDDKPFPTHFWLCSDHLKVAISRIEAQGVIKALESRLQEEADFMAAYRHSHEDYVAQRWQTMSDAERDIVDRQGYRDLFTRRGIGGIANWDQVRCLHMQYAHHLCGDNAIGRWMDAEYDVLACLR
ncbi:DUF501 domain-containing protein [Chromohalobacter canadensis]|uniref:DUF501 domain-containing protein n=1 Tax=Chromohalobacter canadensis TaxID=141389 RepID=A0ABZ0YEC7_9GAMM|nr:DUF501 domain-containing protein [Chromohalobacter canadensis]MCK0767142.1 DUF501 domain-containing protein [Chromohalobacter canadensis]MCT8468194.1 DUF501 domain-containing protein [Chromohalobacter canadensis]MCT8471249.1 DUF501 domain-containing protein [Chromohalobacter canadensis]MCT8498702.1 DUF501 domain-containing protein [Chromohalobacter canadensis]WQH10253.1 DUF501 domain-containing protein [Chromohalobacter canadensis]